jgi:hypothetical protein
LRCPWDVEERYQRVAGCYLVRKHVPLMGGTKNLIEEKK